MSDIKIYMNDIPVMVPEGMTILEASVIADLKSDDQSIEIPALCYRKGLVEEDTSGVCIVEVEDMEGLVPADTTIVSDGMRIITDSPRISAVRVASLKKILEIHNYDCEKCAQDGECELQSLCKKYGIEDALTLPLEKMVKPDHTSVAFTRNNNKCIKCGRCVNVCGKIQNVGAISMTGSGLDASVMPMDNYYLKDFDLGFSKCVNCGQCVAVCPVGALIPRDNGHEVELALKDNEKYVVVQVAPAVRAALGEEFGLPVGTDVEGKIASALRRAGFDAVFDTKFGADLTIVEEATELVERIKKGGKLPMITSCCPGWVKYCESFRPTMIGNLSTCKSPHMMEGAVIKSYVSELLNIKKDNIVVVSIMPCTAKKYEITREEMAQDVDFVITTRELARLLKRAEIRLDELPEEAFDYPLGMGTGAGVIFGATGGVMEAALRTAADLLSEGNAENMEYIEVRGMKAVKEASYVIGGKTIRAAVVSGLANADELLENVEKGKVYYDFIEVMACPGGCINGGGQPYQLNSVQERIDVRAERAEALYKNDKKSPVRKSHENPEIKEIYERYLDSFGSKKAHKLLHTSYTVR